MIDMQLNELVTVFSSPFFIATLSVYMIGASYTDIKDMIIMNESNFVMICLAMLYHFYISKTGTMTALIGALSGFLIILIPAVITNARMGGDIKFAAGLGSWLGFTGLVPVLIAGTAIFIAYCIITKKSRRDFVPFAPFMSIGVIIVTIIVNFASNFMNTWIALSCATIILLIAIRELRDPELMVRRAIW